MRVWVYVVRRVLLAIPVLIGVMTVIFVFVSALPDTQRACAYYQPSGKVSPCTSTIPCVPNPSGLCPNPVYQSAVNALGLNQPIPVQWAIFVGNSLTFNWGYVTPSSSLGTGETPSGGPEFAGQSVTHIFVIFLPYTVELLVLAFAIALLVAVPLYSRATARPGGLAEYGARALTISSFGTTLVVWGSLALAGATFALAGPAGIAGPSAICGSTSTAFLDLFGSWPPPPCAALYGTTNLGPVGYPTWLQWGIISTPTGFPTVDAALHGQYWLAADTVFRMAIPALLLALVAVGAIFRVVRYAPTGRMDLEFLRGERARGLPESRVFPRQARRPSLVAILPALVPTIPWVLMNLILVEILFNLWGVGRIFAAAAVGGVNDWDIGVIFGTMLLFAYIIVATDVFASALRAHLDPRSCSQ
jgi:peptide/nickel transport system permease protein